jgi:hypothetical protein
VFPFDRFRSGSNRRPVRPGHPDRSWSIEAGATLLRGTDAAAEPRMKGLLAPLLLLVACNASSSNPSSSNPTAAEPPKVEQVLCAKDVLGSTLFSENVCGDAMRDFITSHKKARIEQVVPIAGAVDTSYKGATKALLIVYRE